jgi:RecA-family ATPase
MQLDLDEILTTVEVEPTWIVQGIIPAATVVLVAGDAGVGKSVMNLSEGLHVALGREFFGYPTTQTRVLYFDEENSRPDIKSYLQQLWVGMGQPDRELLKPWFRIEHFSLGDKTWPAKMLAVAKAYQPGLIYIDTATSALSIAEENDNAEAQRVVQGLRHVMQDCGSGPAIKILKHAKYVSGGGHGGGTRRTIRGAKAWLGAVDQTMFHIRAQGAPKANGLHVTLLVPDKKRAFGLRGNIRIDPDEVKGKPKGLILKGETFISKSDLMIVPES